MVILRMNRSFDRHGKKFLIFLTILISIAFIGFFTPGESGCAMGSRQNPTVGTVFGESVSMDQITRHNVFISVASYGQAQELYYNLMGVAAAKAAQKMGVVVSDADIASFIVRMFSVNGKFNKEALQKYEDSIKGQYNMSASQYKDAVKLLLTIEKFFNEARVEAIVTPDEVKQFNSQLNEEIEAEVAIFNRNDFAKTATITDTVLTARYNRAVATYQRAIETLNNADSVLDTVNRNDNASEAERTAAQQAFDNARKTMTSAKNGVWLTSPVFSGAVVTIAFNDPVVLEEAKMAISESKINNYFEANKDQYVDLATSKDSIRAVLINNEARRTARNMLQKFINSSDVDDIAMKPAKDRYAAFEAAAKLHKLKFVPVTGFTTTAMDVPGIGTEPEVYDAFVSSTNTSSELSHVVGGFQGAYVTFRTNVIEEQVKPFETVKAEILEVAKNEEGSRLASMAMRKFLADATAALDSGRPHTSVAGAKFGEVLKFSANPDSQLGVPYFSSLLSVATKTPAGKLTSEFSTYEGPAIAFIKSRKNPTATTLDETSPAYIGMKDRKEQMIGYELITWLRGNIAERR